MDPNKPIVGTINWGTPVEIGGSIVGIGAAIAGAPRLGGAALVATGLYDAMNKRKGYGALYGAMGLALFFLPGLKTAQAQVPQGQNTPSLPPAPTPQIIDMPNGNGASISTAVNGVVWVNFLNPLPPGYKWALSFVGDFVADIQEVNTGPQIENLPVYKVTPLGKGNDTITFTAHKYNPDGSPSIDTGPVYLVSFYLNAY
jgi:hypothetical protein